MSRSRQYVSFDNFFANHNLRTPGNRYRGATKLEFLIQLKGSIYPLYEMQEGLDKLKRYNKFDDFLILIDFLQPIRGIGNILRGVVMFLFTLIRCLFGIGCELIILLVNPYFNFVARGVPKERIRRHGIESLWLLEGLCNIIRGIAQILCTPLAWIRIIISLFLVKCKSSLPSVEPDIPVSHEESKSSDEKKSAPTSAYGGPQRVVTVTNLKGSRELASTTIINLCFESSYSLSIIDFLTPHDFAGACRTSKSFNNSIKKKMEDEKYLERMIKREFCSELPEEASASMLDCYKKADAFKITIKKTYSDDEKIEQKDDLAAHELFGDIIYWGYDKLAPLLYGRIRPSFIFKNFDNVPDETFLHIAAKKGLEDVLQWLLSHQELPEGFVDYRRASFIGDCSIQECGDTPLMTAAKNGSIGCLKLLVSCRANIDDLSYKSGQTALHLAAKYGHRKCVEFLIEQKAQDVQDYNGKTPLDLAKNQLCKEAITEGLPRRSL